MTNQRSAVVVPAVSALVLSLAITIATVSGASAATTTTTVSSTLSPVIGLFTSSGTVNLNATPTGAGVQTINNDVITVSTNDSAGYTLKLGETTAASALVSGGNSIVASAGTLASPIAQVANTWGYHVDNIGGFGASTTTSASNAAIGAIKFAGVPATASPDTLKTTATTASSDTTNVWYGVAVNTSTPSGTYTNSVTYTVTAN